MPGDAQERTEDATPRRRQQARRKGTVARSTDLTGSIVTLALVLVLPVAFAQMGLGFMQSVNKGLSGIPQDLSFASMTRYVLSVAAPPLTGLGLLVGTALIIGLATTVAQVGFTLSTEALNPSFAKLNPLTGFQRLFSRQAGFEGFKSLAKYGIFSLVCWLAISGSWNQLAGLSTLPPAGAIAATAAIMKTIGIKIGVTWLVLAAIDYFFQRKQVDRQLRMTKEEVRQEMKEAETSPELKAAQHQRRRRLAKGRMMDAVKTADVVITNPTHYSIAVRYTSGKDHAPVVVAKGLDLLALRIREVAKEHRVPIVPNPPLARALYKKCELGDNVPRELFQGVAEVLAYVYKTLKKVRSEKA